MILNFLWNIYDIRHKLLSQIGAKLQWYTIIRESAPFARSPLYAQIGENKASTYKIIRENRLLILAAIAFFKASALIAQLSQIVD